MARLIYSAICSLDGYIADEQGNFDWAEPDEEAHALINELARPAGTMLLGRRTYEVLLPWETWDTRDEPPVVQDFAEIWRSTDKVVYSRTMTEVASARTRIEREFDPEAVRSQKASATRDLSIGGPDLAVHAMNAGLVDEWQLFLVPMLVGGGKRALPDKFRLKLELLDERRFRSGMVYLCYRAGG